MIQFYFFVKPKCSECSEFTFLFSNCQSAGVSVSLVKLIRNVSIRRQNSRSSHSGVGRCCWNLLLPAMSVLEQIMSSVCF